MVNLLSGIYVVIRNRNLRDSLIPSAWHNRRTSGRFVHCSTYMYVDWLVGLVLVSSCGYRITKNILYMKTFASEPNQQLCDLHTVIAGNFQGSKYSWFSNI